MIKSIVFLNRRSDLSPDEFQQHWRHAHGPLVAGLPGLRRYVQNAPLDLGREAPFDGVSEAWFADLAALRHAVASDRWGRVMEDEAAFLATPTRAAPARLTVVEHEIVVAAPGAPGPT